MEKINPLIIQIISIAVAAVFMFIIFRLIVKGKLREEYSIIWIICTVFFMVFSLWRDGLDLIARLLGVFYPPALLFMGAIFAIILFLVHLSVVSSRQQKQIKELTQELALLKERNERK